MSDDHEPEWIDDPEPEIKFPVLRSDALHGLPGEIVETIAPDTEADPAALLAQLLAALGNLFGRSPHFFVEGREHAGNLFVALVGNTSSARKGTSWALVHRVVSIAAPEWAESRIRNGIVSGEGLFRAVCRPEDATTWDPRLFLQEGEFAKLLAADRRTGNTSTVYLREAWDGGPLFKLSSAGSETATGYHLSAAFHITREDLAEYLTPLALANGFANRVVFVAVRRSKLLPLGGRIDAGTLEAFGERIRRALAFASTVGRVDFDEQARAAWCAVYPALSEKPSGMIGQALARSEAQVLRLSLVYALADLSTEIRLEHLCAALAFWEYVEASARWIWGGREHGNDVQRILGFIAEGGPDGRTRTEIGEHLGHKGDGSKLRARLRRLVRDGLLHRQKRRGGTGKPGRPSTRYILAARADAAVPSYVDTARRAALLSTATPKPAPLAPVCKVCGRPEYGEGSRLCAEHTILGTGEA